MQKKEIKKGIEDLMIESMQFPSFWLDSSFKLLFY